MSNGVLLERQNIAIIIIICTDSAHGLIDLGCVTLESMVRHLFVYRAGALLFCPPNFPLSLANYAAKLDIFFLGYARKVPYRGSLCTADSTAPKFSDELFD